MSLIIVRRSEDRGHADHGWLFARHTFSFADYHDPAWPLARGFRTLRVINEDLVQPGRGFGKHGHRDMEILTWILEGELRHEDSMGNGSVIRPGEIQRMSAGTGVEHSETNPSRERPVHLLQIWLLPDRRGRAPGYEQRAFPEEARRGRLCALAAPAGRAAHGAALAPVAIHQNAVLLTALLAPGESVSHELAPGRHAWVQVARGTLELEAADGGGGSGANAGTSAGAGADAVAGARLGSGDGAAVSGASRLTLRGTTPAEVLLFDLA